MAYKMGEKSWPATYLTGDEYSEYIMNLKIKHQKNK
jgi:hypothetical protein